MTVRKAALIGLGHLGSLLAEGFRLGDTDFVLTGSDLQSAAEKRASDAGWTDRTVHNVFSAVKDADVVILAVPAEQTKMTLELIGPELQPETVLIDCCPNKKASFEWAGQTMIRPENFLGVWPVIRDNRLKGGTLFIAAEKNTSEAAVRLGAELAGLWEMKRSFTDPAELDGIIAAVYHLPLITQEAYMNCLTGSPGWADREKALGKSSGGILFPGTGDPDQKNEAFTLLSSRDDCVQQLDELISRLLAYRSALTGGNEQELKMLFEMNGPLRKAGSAGQRPADPDAVTAGEVMRQTFFGGFLRKNRRQ